MYEESVIIKDWRNVDFSFGLIYPNNYKLGMSSYSIRLLYHLINSNERAVCERIYLPEKIKFPASKDLSSIDRLRSIENKVLPKDFDILGFSVHYENDYRNILWILDKSQIPLDAKKRHDSYFRNVINYPLIIGGGPAVTSNPLPLSKVFDLFFIGDAEPNLNIFFDVFMDYQLKKINFQAFLDRLKNIEGIFIPALDNKTNRAVLKNLDESPTPQFQLLAKNDNNNKNKIFEENYFVEVNRGCPYQCKFCLSSFHNSPFRNKSYEEIIKTIEEGIKHSNFKKISLIGSCISSHPKFVEICEFIINKGKNFSIPSIRLEHITPKIIKIFEKNDVKTITIAPETGTESLRYNLGKKISNEKILQVLNQIKESKIKKVKFYFLVGLPNETDDDVLEIINLLKSIKKIGFTRNELKVNINPFVPKLNTPYGNKCHFYLSNNLSNLKLKLKTLEEALKNIVSIKFKNSKNIVNNARLQALISLGDRNVSELLLQYYFNGANMGALRRAEKDLNFSIDSYFQKVQDGYKPWII